MTGMIPLFNNEAQTLFDQGENMIDELDIDIGENRNGPSYEAAVELETAFNKFIQAIISCDFSSDYFRKRTPRVEARHLLMPHGQLPDQSTTEKKTLRRTHAVTDMIGTAGEMLKAAKTAFVCSVNSLIRGVDLLNEAQDRQNKDYQRPTTEAHQKTIAERPATSGHTLSVPRMNPPATTPTTATGGSSSSSSSSTSSSSSSSSSSQMVPVSQERQQVQERIDTGMKELVRLCLQRQRLEAQAALQLSPPVNTSALPSGILLAHTNQPGMSTAFTGAEVSVDEPHGDELIALYRAMHGIQQRDTSISYVNMKYPRYINQISPRQSAPSISEGAVDEDDY